LSADGYDPDTNTIYLFHGNYWHGNPAMYDANKINAHNGKTFGELYNKTKQVENKFLEYGYKLVVVWEAEWTASRRL
jgi:G:T-mismatch repair DNA endonuclease (very short patch repair protein)